MLYNIGISTPETRRVMSTRRIVLLGKIQFEEKSLTV
jgi:hypothetical protein